MEKQLKVVLSKKEPQNKHVLWLEQDSLHEISPKVFNNGDWENLKTVNVPEELLNKVGELNDNVKEFDEEIDNFSSDIASFRNSLITETQQRMAVDSSLGNRITSVTATANNNTTSLNTLETTLNTNLVNLKAKDTELEEEISSAEGHIIELQDNVSSLQTEISNVKNNVVPKAVADGIAKVVANAPEDLDTLKEVADYIASDKIKASAIETAISNLQKQDTTHSNQIATLQTKMQDVIYTNQDQQGAINAQAAGLTEAERRIQEHTTQIGLVQEEVNEVEKKRLSLSVKDNGNIILSNTNGESKEFMPATPSGDPMHYAYEAMEAVYNSGADVIAKTPWASLVDDADYNAKWGLNLIPDNATFVKTLKYNGVDREVWQMKHPNKNFQIWVVAEYASDGTKVWDDTLVVKRSGMWYMDGLGDLTNTQMAYILNDPHPAQSYGSCSLNKGRYIKFYNGLANTVISDLFCYSNINIEIWVRGYLQAVNSSAFFSGSYIRHIMSREGNKYKLTLNTSTNIPYLSTLFFEVTKSVTLAMPTISAKSMIKCLQESNPTTAITLTFPSALYDRLMDTSTTLGAELVALLESKSNITFARGE